MEREVERRCQGCGRPTRFKITRRLPQGLALLCRSCWAQRARAIAAARSPKQALRKSTDKKPRA
jgi:hypothetical protein